jgi:multiple sugar transport system permease protein
MSAPRDERAHHLFFVFEVVMWHQLRKSLVWYVFIAPTFIIYALFVAYPTLQTFRLSVFREVATKQEFVGAAQYLRLLTTDIFYTALLNTIGLGIAFLVIVVPLSLILASLLNQLRIAPNLFKTIYFLPQITSTVAIALIFSYVFQPSWGLVNGTLHALGVSAVPLWLAEPRVGLTGSRALATIMAVWTALGYEMLIFLAGLQAVPSELYDAAVVDGAGSLQVWWYITIPSLRPTVIFILLTGTIDAMSRFSDLWTLGGPSGSPARSLQTVVMYMYQTAFEGSDFNLASAIAVVMFVIVLVLTLVNFRLFLRRDFASAD